MPSGHAVQCLNKGTKPPMILPMHGSKPVEDAANWQRCMYEAHGLKEQCRESPAKDHDGLVRDSLTYLNKLVSCVKIRAEIWTSIQSPTSNSNIPRNVMGKIPYDIILKTYRYPHFSAPANGHR